MAASSLLLLIDDIATLLDDVALMTKIAARQGISAADDVATMTQMAARKTAGVPGDDLALNAEQVTGVRAVADPRQDMVAFEKDRISGAIRTDFILSAEIIVITLGTVAQAGFGQQVVVLVGISLVITVGVYGLVAGIVKLDDAGMYLDRQAASWKKALGRAILQAAPWLMKTLSVVGTAAMFLVGGGILVHGVPMAGHALDAWAATLGWAAPVLSNFGNAVAGMAAGLVVVGAVTLVKRLCAGSGANLR